ncbi:MAG: transglycosylase domain-containing protein [Crocinitomicaceae bacterium]|tara:strand:+ start:24941 stop:27463 length:2523 start_codon:yes stop_codon:yes gene_type:complete
MNEENRNITKIEKRFLYVLFWLLGLFPLMVISSLYLLQSEDDLPPVAMLANPPELLASNIIANSANGDTVIIGKFWQVNRSSVSYSEISPFVVDALIATEDERFMQHSGIDFRALMRSVSSMGSSGGASTIPQQLAKLLFTLQKRSKEKTETKSMTATILGKFGRINEKAQEHIIATRLEQTFTKKEIITMYLNQFDYLYNAVGIENAAMVYFNKKAIDLSKTEAATLVGMCKNPGLYNPHSYSTRNYGRRLSVRNKIKIEEVKQVEIDEARAKDSIRAISRRNQVLFQWLRNSERNNPDLSYRLTRNEYDSLKQTPIVIDYTTVDHKEGLAPYFRESLRQEVSQLLKQKNKTGEYQYAKKDGTPYNIYRDGLKIYTTLNTSLQEKAEAAVEKHLSGKDPLNKNAAAVPSLQQQFDRNNRGLRRFPFSNKLSKETVNSILNRAKNGSARSRAMKRAGLSIGEIENAFNIPTQMKVFSWNGEIDTVMTPFDSIRYYKSYLHTGLISIDPRTGFVKAWVGGANFKHFSYDHARQGKRQVGSTIKPFVYATALSMHVVNPCTKFNENEHCVDIVDENNVLIKQYCPGGDAAETVSLGISKSSNPTTAGVMGRMGRFNSFLKTGGPFQINKLLRKMNIFLRPEDLVPAMCLGSMDLSLYELVSAQCVFVNDGVYNKPTTILRIEDRNGKKIYEAKQEREKVMSPTVAYEILKMMIGVVQGGTGSSLRGTWKPWGGVSAPTAGKTGTTQNNSDGWFMGLTPGLVTGVWVGAEDRSVRFKTMTWGQGARMALPIYGYYMQKVYADRKLNWSKEDFAVPENYNPEEFKCEEIATPDNGGLGGEEPDF